MDKGIFIRCKLWMLKIYRFILEYIFIAEWFDWENKGKRTDLRILEENYRERLKYILRKTTCDEEIRILIEELELEKIEGKEP